MTTPEPPTQSLLSTPQSAREIFIAFTLLALQGFGGVIAVAQRVLVDQRGWLSRDEFVELLAVAQVLPGPNVCNLALMVGDRFLGWRGAFAALSGMMALPLILVLLATALYAQFAQVPAVAGALQGMGAASAGMIIGASLRLIPSLRTNPLTPIGVLVIGVAAFVAVAWGRYSLIMVLLGLGGLSCLVAWWRLVRQGVKP